MVHSRFALATAVLLVAATSEPFAQTSDGNVKSLEGVWQIVETVEGTNAPNPHPEPSQIIYTKTHYSYLAINRARAKVEKPANPRQLTDAEKLTRYDHWAAMTAHSGTYEFKDGIVRTHAVVAKNESVMNAVEEFEVKSERGLVWLVSRANAYSLGLKRIE